MRKEGLVTNTEYNILRLTELFKRQRRAHKQEGQRWDLSETDIKFDVAKKCWEDLLYGCPVPLTILERSFEDGNSINVETVKKGAGLVFMKTLDKGFISYSQGHHFEYNEDGEGFPLKLLIDTKGFFEWERENYPNSDSSEDGIHLVPSFIRDFLSTVLIPVATTLKKD